ncbi:hypothetical protein [Bacillus sp. FJAT-49736]|uniref:hypothetical protein n=1 Tax=Bacillus sp. FJAT-49736 TaxID=2833582 RepID=UPI001BC8E65A|nr:hypothetical protein [Bacillus sp. FJAT-49736]MBS4174692.1 hypothetical protein [Bacillus sp. FJAT-49736]
MKKILLLTFILTILVPYANATAQTNLVKAAFLRDGNLWIFVDGKEKQVTNSGNVPSAPKWSRDGKLLVYQQMGPSKFSKNEQQSEVWTYNLESGKRKQIYHNGHSLKWGPHKNILAFSDKGILDISNLSEFFNIAMGVNDYAWLPKGDGFLLSSSGTLRPDGWSSASLFTKKVGENYRDIVLFGGVKPFFTLPKEIGTTNKNKLIAVYAEQLSYSPSGKWVSFVVSPTASWSMDSNMVCVIDSTGKNFKVLDEIILQVGSPKWAPSTDSLAFIAGGGRLVFDFKNKKLRIKELPASGTFTPDHFADIDFNWITNELLVVSRMKEGKWSNDFSKHPLPVLYSVDVSKNMQTKLTNPPKGLGDYAPQYVKSMNKLVWLRGSSILNENRDLWMANLDGSHEKKLLQNVQEIVFY